MKKKQRNMSQPKAYNPFEPQDNRAKLMESLNQIDSKSIRCKFKNAQDPINLAFDTIESASLKSLAADFIKDSFFDIVSFITDSCK